MGHALCDNPSSLINDVWSERGPMEVIYAAFPYRCGVYILFVVSAYYSCSEG
jgi:hypothetical protein